MNRGRKPDVFVDLCTQRDYLTFNGARPVSNADDIVPNVKRMMALARWGGFPILSCVDARRPDEVRGLQRPDCVLGTAGQLKLPFTVLPKRTTIDSDNCLCIALDILQRYQQVVFTKHHRDPFTNPKLDRLLTEMPARRFVIFGVPLESSIRLLTLGLMLRHRPVAVVRDACGWWDPEEGHMTLRQLEAKGCELVHTRDLIEASLRQVKRAGRRRSVA